MHAASFKPLRPLSADEKNRYFSPDFFREVPDFSRGKKRGKSGKIEDKIRYDHQYNTQIPQTHHRAEVRNDLRISMQAELIEI